MALANRERLLAEEPEDQDLKSLVAHSQGYLGQVLLQRGKPAEAEPRFRRSIDLYESLGHDFPDTPSHLRRLCMIYSYLSEALGRMRRFDEAKGLLRRAIELRRKIAVGYFDPGDRPVWGGDLYEALGLLSLETAHEREAVDAFRLAREHYERAVTDHPDVGWLLVDYARFLTTCPAIQFRDTDRALALARQALRSVPYLSEGWRVLGVAECRAGHWTAAVEALEKWATFDTYEDAEAGFSCAIAHGRLGHAQDARRWYDRAIGWMDQQRSRDDDLRRLRSEAAKLLGLPEPSHRTGMGGRTPRRAEAPRLS